MFRGGDGIVDTTYTFPTLVFAPRFGMAYDLTGKQKIDPARRHRHSSTTGRSATRSSAWRAIRRRRELVTVRYGQLQSLGQGGLTTQGPPALNTIDYEAKLPTSTQFSGGVQMAIPWATTLDVEWVGQHSYNTRPHREHQRRRSRRGVPAAEPEPEPGEHDAGRRGGLDTT